MLRMKSNVNWEHGQPLFSRVECVATGYTYVVWLVPILFVDVDEVIGAHLADGLLLVGAVREHVHFCA